MWGRRLRWVALLLALSTLATCPVGYRACVANRRAAEATSLLRYLADRLIAYHHLHSHFPIEGVGPTPDRGACCEAGGVCAPDPTKWATPGWRELGFSIDDPHRYVYSYETADHGATSVIRAIGDLDCNGVTGEYQGLLTADGDEVHITWSSARPTE